MSKNIVLFDGETAHAELLPITFTRPVADIRLGIFTIREKWERLFPGDYSYLTEDYLASKFPAKEVDETFYIAGNVCPSQRLVEEIEALGHGESLGYQGTFIAFRGTPEAFRNGDYGNMRDADAEPCMINHLFDIFLKNGEALEADYLMIARNEKPAVISPTNRIVGDLYYPDGTPKIFIEKGATVECAVLNVSEGPVYIGKDAEVMEGSCIRAPFAACEHAVVKMGTKIYGATTLGPYCKVGGELSNVVMLAYSNKGHDGFLGNAVIGEWCNLGAGTNASNLKNDYSEIKLWNYPSRRFLRTGLQFCGLIMGDHSKAGINCMFNTATVLGVGVNVHGAGYPRNFVASFSEGGTSGFADVQLPKFYSIAERMMARRGKVLTDEDKAIYEAIYTQAENLK
ncbi:putative sugar nucleotidyl transferase [Coprobacter tertius]|uniref:Glucose-1-phosphate thymidylyltransferase n=1 Tax=Coprobacter tertius TaxID=2944915 RepID=A0ABT1MI20_9BACT|nr:putative sugar nucleotidyl transferase [Coprobacter tertius]MCP9612265.1 glucose-1-phosphate thymidylyltransferase [Coprobacter tertius]